MLIILLVTNMYFCPAIIVETKCFNPDWFLLYHVVCKENLEICVCIQTQAM